jgi:hypothetical protein
MILLTWPNSAPVPCQVCSATQTGQDIRALGSGGNTHRQEPTSVKKMRKCDATWTTMNIILRWILDTVHLTVEIPAHRVARLFELLDSVPTHQRHVSIKKWQHLVGELRSTILAVPGGQGMFIFLHQVLKVRTENGTIL